MRVSIDTECGGFEIELALTKAPVTAGYFRDIVRAGAFEKASVFRIVNADNASLRVEHPIEVIQAGLMESDRQLIAPIRHEPTSETGLRHDKWSVSTARAGPGETYGSFFICMRDEPELDHGGKRHPDGLGFATFGEVVKGYESVEAILNRRETKEFLKNRIYFKGCRLIS